MAILVGIDEARYGPVLGPLVVSATAWRVPDDTVDRCLWDLLRQSVCRQAVRRDRRPPILDSKKLYHRKMGLAGLERSALAALGQTGISPAFFRDLLSRVCPGAMQTITAIIARQTGVRSGRCNAKPVRHQAVRTATIVTHANTRPHRTVRVADHDSIANVEPSSTYASTVPVITPTACTNGIPNNVANGTQDQTAGSPCASPRARCHATWYATTTVRAADTMFTGPCLPRSRPSQAS